jgi:phosphoglycolate phosphatase
LREVKDKKIMKEYSTYIFDLDGTLLDTLNDIAVSTNYALHWAGMPEHTVDDVKVFVGNGVKKLIERAMPDGINNPKFEMTYSMFKEHYIEHSMDTTKPYPGILETLAELKKKNKKIAVVSNKFYDATQKLCRHFFSDYIQVSIGERENIRKKPAPDTVLEALRQLGAERETAVYIGDSDVDVNTAKNSGLPCISVLWGFRDKKFLIEHGATIFISEPNQLLDY